MPISGEQFTKRILRPFDESHFLFLVQQGFDLFQMTVTDVDNQRAPIISIPKGG